MFENLLAVLAVVCVPALAQVGNPAITTGQYNSGRTSANTNETILTPSNVDVDRFGKLFSWTVDGWIFAQPLYVPNLKIGGTTTNVVFVATMHNSVYAFDANQPGAGPLWQASLGPSVTAPNANGCPSSDFTGPELGILSTPVIDQASDTLYAVAATPVTGGFAHFLHALNLLTGKDNLGSPVQIQASVSGNGYDTQGGTITLSPSSSTVQRTALLLANGSVYAGFGNCGPDNDPWHGWVVGYRTSNLQTQTLLFNSTPNGGQGGIWQSGRGLVADSVGDLYFTTGNASQYNGNDTNVTTRSSTGDAAINDYPVSFLQLSSAGQVVTAYPPKDYTFLNDHDLDFSSSGPLLIPGHNLVVAGGKEGIVYLFNTADVGAPLQSFQATGGGACITSGNECDQIHDLAFWNSNLYIWGTSDVLRSYRFSNGQFNTTPSSQNSQQLDYHPASLAVSANEAANGVVWAMTPDSTLHAYKATDVATELWNSNQNASRDALPSAPRFTEPTVVNGRVYMATQSGQLAVYGLLSDFTVSTSTPSVSIDRGHQASFAVEINALSVHSTVVNLSVIGLPSGAIASFRSRSITGSGVSVVTIDAAASTPTGTYNLIVKAKAGRETRTGSVTMVVTTPSDTVPQWTCCTYSRNGSSSTMNFSAWDSQSGMKSIRAVQQVDASVSIPSFTAGTNSPIDFSAAESGWSSYVKFQLKNVAGYVSYLSVVLVDQDRQKGARVSHAVKHLTRAEGLLTVVNMTPGLKNVRIEITGDSIAKRIQVSGLHDGEVRVVNLMSLLPSLPGARDITLTPLGKPGGSALFVFADTEMPPKGGSSAQ